MTYRGYHDMINKISDRKKGENREFRERRCFPIRQYRNEWKYVCKQGELVRIAEKLSGILEKDTYCGSDGSYEVHSLYFDRIDDSCMMDTDAGLGERCKWRIRCYGNDRTVFKLERKEKKNGKCCKQSCFLSLDTFQEIMGKRVNEVFWKTEEILLKKFCVDAMTGLLEPKVIIDYERTAYVEPATNLRITLDRNISAAYAVEDFSEGGYIRYPVQEKEKHVLEVKFDHILPGYIKSITNDGSLIQTSFSKYYLGRMRLKNMGR